MARFAFISYEDTASKLMEHACANYDKGWDVVVECESVKDIAETLRAKKVWSLGGAIRLFWESKVKTFQEGLANSEAHLHPEL